MYDEEEWHPIEPKLSGKPKNLEIYVCFHCGFDSAFPDTQEDKRCFFCNKGDGLTLLHSEEISMEVIVKRMAYSTRRMNMALRGAYDLTKKMDKKSFLKIWNDPDLMKPDEDEEKRMLDLMAMGKDLEDNITSIFSKKAKKPAKESKKTAISPDGKKKHQQKKKKK